MTVYQLNPLQDPRWEDFVQSAPVASIFHTRGWLQALQRTYGYHPVAFTTSRPESDLEDGLVFCDIRSWITGRRLVSLPFSDHCQPLAEGLNFHSMLDYLLAAGTRRKWKYVELRPLDDPFSDGTRSGISKSSVYAFHRIDLTPSEESIYRGFHDSCVRRKIRKAERENLNYEAGCSEELLAKFRHLLLKTRRRHMLPPQPSLWFQNLLKCLGSCVKIHVLSQQSTPVAAILTLSFRDSLTYKYGCSDERFHKLGGMPLLFWKAIQEAKRDGMKDLDLGRSSYEDPGLSAFKMHLGASESELNYYRSPASPPLPKKQEFPFVRQALVRLPDSAFARVGRLIYKHLG